MSQNYYGSIDFDKLMENLKKGTLKTHKTENGKRYINVNIYMKDEPNQYGDIASISSPLKEEFHIEENGKKINKVFIGNLKKSENTAQETTAKDFEEDNNGLSF